MSDNSLSKFKKSIININKKTQIIILICLLLSLFSIYFLVLFTGGIKHPYSHTMYIPIVITGLLLGKFRGATIGLLSGILLGPLMPLDTITMESQIFINWFYRLIIFTSIGFLSGLLAIEYKKDMTKIINIYSVNPETLIPNTNALSNLILNSNSNEDYLLITVLINNNTVISDLIGSDSYFKVLGYIYKILQKGLDKYLIILQSSVNKFWISKTFENIDEEIQNLLKILKDPIIIDGIPLFIDYSIGISTVKGMTKCTVVSVYRQSDTAAHFAYKHNKPYEIFKENYFDNKFGYELLGSLENALNSGETFLMFQPKIDLVNNKENRFEALIRWNHPKKGLIKPCRFIPLVEKTNLIDPLTRWVLNKVCQKIVEFKDQGIDVCIGINISVRNLSNPKFFELITSTIKKYKVHPRQLELEITESLIINNPDDNIALLKKFMDYGFTTTIDDFGVGYASLQYLARLPIKIIKIDKSFISQVTSNDSTRIIVKSFIDMAHQLGYTVVAEGIENQETLDETIRIGCDYGQGYFISEPILSDEVINWYKDYINQNPHNII